jgi:hypothetical protein
MMLQNINILMIYKIMQNNLKYGKICCSKNSFQVGTKKYR